MKKILILFTLAISLLLSGCGEDKNYIEYEGPVKHLKIDGSAYNICDLINFTNIIRYKITYTDYDYFDLELIQYNGTNSRANYLTTITFRISNGILNVEQFYSEIPGVKTVDQYYVKTMRKQ